MTCLFVFYSKYLNRICLFIWRYRHVYLCIHKGPFTLSRIASRIIPDLNPGCSSVRHHDFFSMPVWIRSELGVYTGKYGVSTDRQGSNADHAGNMHTELTRISRKSTEARYFYGPYTEVYVVYWDISGMLTLTWACRRSFDIQNFKPGWNRC